MKAVIIMCLTEMISTKFGVSRLNQIYEKANIPTTERQFFATMDTPDENVLAIFNSTCDCLDLSPTQVGELFGEY